MQNEWIPCPDLVDVEYTMQQEAKNDQLEPNQIMVTIFNSERLMKLDGYLDYTLNCDPKQSFHNYFEFKKFKPDEVKSFIHAFPPKLLPEVLKNLKEGELSITLKKSKLGGMMSSDVETVKIKLLNLGTMCTLAREVSIQNQKFKIEVAIHKATFKKQVEETVVKKKGLGPIVDPFQPLVLEEGKIGEVPQQPKPQV
jgi:hypothetical protein